MGVHVEPSECTDAFPDFHCAVAGGCAADAAQQPHRRAATHSRRLNFLGAALTDFFDGRLARSRKQVSKLGKLLDPIADKLLISAALIALVENHLAPAWAVVIIVGREFAVTGLRSVAATEGKIISASGMGKFKMVMQVITVGLLILSLPPSGGGAPVSNFGKPFPAIKFWTVPELKTAWGHLTGPGNTTWADWQVLLYTTGRAMLWIVVLSAIYSMWDYFRAFYAQVVREKQAKAKASAAAATAQERI